MFVGGGRSKPSAFFKIDMSVAVFIVCSAVAFLFLLFWSAEKRDQKNWEEQQQKRLDEKAAQKAAEREKRRNDFYYKIRDRI